MNSDGTSSLVQPTLTHQAPNFVNNWNTHAQTMRNLSNQSMTAALHGNESATGAAIQAYQDKTRGVRQSAEDRARQAYIKRLRSMNNLPRMLRAQGINGGAAESTTARMSSNFDNKQFGIMRDRENLLFDIQSRIAQIRGQGAQNAANIKNQHSIAQMNMEQQLENQHIAAIERDQASFERQRADVLANLGQHSQDFQARINYLTQFGDRYGEIPHLQMMRQDKIANEQAVEEMQLLRHLDNLAGRPAEELRGHLGYFQEHGWVHNFIQNLINNWYKDEEDRALEIANAKAVLNERIAQANLRNNMW